MQTTTQPLSPHFNSHKMSFFYKVPIFNGFLVANLLYFILSSFGWISGFIPEIIITIFGVTTYIIYFLINGIKIPINVQSVQILISFLALFAYDVLLGAYSMPLSYIPGILLCFLPNFTKKILLRFITKWYGIFISFSIILYIILMCVELPPMGIIDYYIYDPYKNYIVYLQSTNPITAIRFNAFFFEPGHCALVGVFLLMANRFQINKNKYLIPILVSVLISLSLAGYVLIIVGLLMLNIKHTKAIIIFIVTVAFCYLLVTYIWNEGENPVNELIVSRLEYSEDGGIKGNNRAYMLTDTYLDNAIDDGKIWTGIGITNFNKLFNHSIAGSGYKIFLLQYGIIGMILLGLLYWSFSLSAEPYNKSFARMFLLFIALAFLQRTYTFWFSWQLTYICSIAIKSNNNKYGY